MVGDSYEHSWGNTQKSEVVSPENGLLKWGCSKPIHFHPLAAERLRQNWKIYGLL